ncbi:uncharacterized protein LOC128679276 [Plodia interpunctella]|uniref:uncharacterized protein LOC128679276 n=1 Tax=Plodia interpunctella TaxID=58824 RepID=UPI0023686D8F|nr:uncharacterized protein LOC128679276 [Plodia interpunctella]XP_053617383.1 uncharacterized protein LOC128679276 [Plodia interpunctella]XP_053617391.1 uncharacterized protein LOC128679276 [Plodia interpunctella]XP_053617401.1 uncharacterized protein LOC128679276 [Plodia interpunctella]XP_053617409.1 uncharacterized protein LOC128679276 [Plodia interpunctella]XP_053617417.1 uncharacterized protein LOC128679276 [Plodia interpunctella]XP_053617424.1 uncharacterized protein LOC128679276 [Plodia
MAPRKHTFILCSFMIIAIIAPHFTAEPPTADQSINKDRTNRQAAIKAGKRVPTTPKWGFFGTVFHLILEQINDTKSAYSQISELVNNQFADDNAVNKAANSNSNDTTEAPKISRAEFLKILDRNLKGLARLRNLENRIAKEDSMKNLRRYKDEIFGKKNQNRRK